MKVLGIIPARYASTRFPGKPLVDIQGKPMIQHVYERTVNSQLFHKVVVATDDERIEKAVLNFGGKVMLTSENHKSGTDRCVEVWEKIKQQEPDYQIVVNIQGDEPYIDTTQLQTVIECFTNKEVEIATLKKEITQERELFSNNVVKVVTNVNEKALYFSRLPIPFCRDKEETLWLSHSKYYKHIGVYAYKTTTLESISKLPQGKLELTESLEQLRWLEAGYSIAVAETTIESVAIDTPEDLQKIV